MFRSATRPLILRQLSNHQPNTGAFVRLGVFDATANRAGTLEIPIAATHRDPAPTVASAPNP